MYLIGKDGKKIVESFQIGNLKMNWVWWLIIGIVLVIILLPLLKYYQKI